MGVRNFYAWHDAQQRAFDAAHPELMDDAAAYAADQVPVAESPEDSEAVTDYRDRRGA